MRTWAARSIPGYDIDAETENFIDYWRSKPGAAATKTDWPATWRTWMRRNAKEAPQSPRNNGRASGNGYKPFQNPTDPNAYKGTL